MAPASPAARRLSSADFFHEYAPVVKNHSLQKSGDFAEGGRSFLCEPKMDIHTPPFLWKTPVENIVENVENSELSTGISLLSRFSSACGKVCIAMWIFPAGMKKTGCYVTGTGSGLFTEIAAKSLQSVKSRCHFLFPFDTGAKFFVKND